MRWKRMSVDIEKRNFSVAHKMGDGCRACYPAPAFSEPHLIALKLILLFFSPFFFSHCTALGTEAVIYLLFDSIHCL